MKICISSESTIDLKKELLEEFNIKTVPFTILLGDKMGFDGEVTSEEIYDYVDLTGELPKTSAVNDIQYEKHFKKLLEEYDEIIHISFSSELSSACSNAYRVANDIGHVHVIDSRTLSSGIALLAIYASNLVKEGKSVDEIVQLVNKRIDAVEASFVLSTVDYLHKGGRCSALAMIGANLFRIRPQIIVKDGKMMPGKKYMGKQSECVRDYCTDILNEFNNPDLSLCFITYSSNTPDLIAEATKLVEARGFKRIIYTTSGSTISSHCGPRCLGILYFNDGGVK